MSATKTYVANRDVVQTVLHALGLEKGEYMTGRVLHEVFQKPQPELEAVSKGKGYVYGYHPLLSTCAILLSVLYY